MAVPRPIFTLLSKSIAMRMVSPAENYLMPPLPANVALLNVYEPSISSGYYRNLAASYASVVWMFLMSASLSTCAYIWSRASSCMPRSANRSFRSAITGIFSL